MIPLPTSPSIGVRRLACRLALGCSVALLTGCATVTENLGYYWQSVSGHVRLMAAARPVPDWMADAQTPERLKARLVLSQQIRDFAITELGLPDNSSYRRYADLRRPAAVWNVVAAPPDALTLRSWCFPVTGCVTYRGYFDEADARGEAARQAAAGYEVGVYGVPAYSTLGWLNPFGGDPLLNTFIGYPEGELARTLFHELAHQVVFAPGDTVFNESFATAVERLGGARWLAERASSAARAEFALYDGRRTAFRALTLATRQQLAELYATHGDPSKDRAPLESSKQRILSDFRDRYAVLKASWGGYSGYDTWVREANNASFGAQAVYDELVPGFEALFAREQRKPGSPWPRFYDAVKQLAAMDPAKRRAALAQALHTTTVEEKDGA